MKYHLILENAAGEQLDMSTTANRYMMSKVTGLDPPGATISTATYATMNGSQLNRAFLEKRNIVISFEMRGVGVEKRRHRLYRVAKPSEYIKVYYRTSNIDVYTEGVVETCEPSRFDMPVSGQISILCPDVYFYSTQDTIVQHGSIVSGFKFPFAIAEKPGVPLGVYRTDNSITIQNNGDTIGMEITLEANPDVVTPENLAGFAAAGVTRISFGVQSADDAQLRRLGRTHTAAAAAQAFAWAREAGFREICGDIMLALPYYSIAEFDKTLALLQAGGCTHISAYLLKIEPGTAFGRNPPPGLPDADAAAEFYLYAVQRLAQEGYRQYEISNFACPGHEGRHNLLYWNCKDYWGIGPAAHSCLGSVRRFWPNDTAAFIAGTVQEQYEGPCNAEDYLIMQLRLCSGLNLTEYAARYGVRFDAGQMAFLRHCAASGYAVLDGDTLRLTPSGMIVQNAILEELI